MSGVGSRRWKMVVRMSCTAESSSSSTARSRSLIPSSSVWSLRTAAMVKPDANRWWTIWSFKALLMRSHSSLTVVACATRSRCSLSTEVADHGHGHGSTVSRDGAEADLDRELRPIGVETEQLRTCSHRSRSRGGCVPGPVQSMHRPRPDGEQALHTAAEENVAVVAEHLLDPTIRHHDLAVVVAHENPIGCELDDHPRESDAQRLRRPDRHAVVVVKGVPSPEEGIGFARQFVDHTRFLPASGGTAQRLKSSEVQTRLRDSASTPK